MGCCSDEARAQREHLYFGHAWRYLKNVYTDEAGVSILGNLWWWMNIFAQAIPLFGPLAGSIGMAVAYHKYYSSVVKKFIVFVFPIIYFIQALAFGGMSQYIPVIGTFDFFFFVLRIGTHANLWATYVRRIRPYGTDRDVRLGDSMSYNLLQDIPAKAVMVMSLPFYIGPVLLYFVYGPYLTVRSCGRKDHRGKVGFMDFLTFVLGFPAVALFYHIVLVALLTPLLQQVAFSLCLLWVLSVFAKIEYYNGDVYEPLKQTVTMDKAAAKTMMVGPVSADDIHDTNAQEYVRLLYAHYDV